MRSMIGKKLRHWFSRRNEPVQRVEQNTQEAAGSVEGVRWIDANRSGWGVPLLDIRPLLERFPPMPEDPLQTSNALSFRCDDGTGFLGMPPARPCRHEANLSYRIAKDLSEGALFLPRDVEEKWAIYLHAGGIRFIESWSRRLRVVAEACIEGEFLTITGIDGAFLLEGESRALTVRIVDFLLRTHALGIEYPVPIPPELPPEEAAFLALATFGRRAHFVTRYELPGSMPLPRLRSDSLLHLAVAQGERERVARYLHLGFHRRARDEQTPLHWAVCREESGMTAFLLERGAPVDIPGAGGETPLMTAARSGAVEQVSLLLAQGADPNATDERGFSPLHHAVAAGESRIVEILLEHGADPEACAKGGETPRTLAASAHDTACLERLQGGGKASSHKSKPYRDQGEG
ncbi:MAG: ankyrin repeat domain-containing protein [Deltaproteobacteria bacterium]|nr:MAG: ankyrin repeat domain-containing protein [Deltaproteobacteria bacterium]